MSKLRDIINGVAVDAANTMGADITGIEPITPNTAEVRIKDLMLELIGEDEEKPYIKHDGKYAVPISYGDIRRRNGFRDELREKVEAL